MKSLTLLFRIQPSTCSSPACDDDPTYCPGYQICSPVTFTSLLNTQTACVIIFTVDIVIRFFLVALMPTRLSGTIPVHWDTIEAERAKEKGDTPNWDPYFSPLEQLFRYILTFQSIIDIISIVPSYIALSNSGSQELSFVRVLRLFRILQINKRGEMVVGLLNRTLYNSREAVVMLLIYLGIIIIVFASLIYSLEGGTFMVNSDWPEGQFLRDVGLGLGYSVSPFDSIPTAMYWAFITATTVGYGDLTATSKGGRAVSSILAITSVLVLALPISIIGSNFSQEYSIYLKKLEELQVKRLLNRKIKKNVVNKFLKRNSITGFRGNKNKPDSTKKLIDNENTTNNNNENDNENIEFGTTYNNDHQLSKIKLPHLNKFLSSRSFNYNQDENNESSEMVPLSSGVTSINDPIQTRSVNFNEQINSLETKVTTFVDDANSPVKSPQTQIKTQTKSSQNSQPKPINKNELIQQEVNNEDMNKNIVFELNSISNETLERFSREELIGIIREVCHIYQHLEDKNKKFKDLTNVLYLHSSAQSVNNSTKEKDDNNYEKIEGEIEE